MDLEQIIRAIFKADTAGADSSIARLDASLSKVEARADAAAEAVASVGRGSVGGMDIDAIAAGLGSGSAAKAAGKIDIDAGMIDRMERMRLEAARVAADMGESEIDAIARELAIPMKASVEIDDDDLLRMERTRNEADALGKMMTGELATGLDYTEEGFVKVGKAANEKGAGGIGKFWGSLKRVADLVPGLGMGGLIGGLVSAFAALFDLISSSTSMDKLARELGEIATGARNATNEINKVLQKTAELYRNPDDLKGQNLEASLALARSKGDDDAEADLGRQIRVHDAALAAEAAEKRRHEIQTREYELNRKLGDAQDKIWQLTNLIGPMSAVQSDGVPMAGDWQKAYQDAFPDFMEALTVRTAAEFQLASVLPEQRALAEEAVRLAMENLSIAGDFRFEDFVPKTLDARGARINVVQRITTNDPAQLAGATLLGAFRGLVKQTLTSSVLSPSAGR